MNGGTAFFMLLIIMLLIIVVIIWLFVNENNKAKELAERVECERLGRIEREKREQKRIEKERQEKELQEKINDYYKIASESFKNKDYKKSIDYYTKLIELKPNYAAYYNNRGVSYDELNDNLAALEDYIKAIELNPESTVFFENRARFFERLNKSDLALKDWQVAAKLGSNIAGCKIKSVIQNNLNQEVRIPADVRRNDRINLAENSDYAGLVNAKNNCTFQEIRSLSVDFIRVNGSCYEILQTQYLRGKSPINEYSILMQYFYSYGKKHEIKLTQAFDVFFNKFTLNGSVDIIDWGCGQALATTIFLDYIKRNNVNDFQLNKIILIEPSEIATKRGVLHINKMLQNTNYNPIVKVVNKKLNDLQLTDIYTVDDNIKLHFMSNILDVTFFDIDILIENLINSQNGVNHYICVSPNYITGNERLDNFLSNLRNHYNGALDCYSERSAPIGNCQRYEKLIAINANE